jgi:hypothetical protein
MYYEAIFPAGGSALDDGIETAAQWVQWALAGINKGAVENETDIRYNLNQFWVQKASIYDSESPDGQTQLNKLDVYAHGLWNALETGITYASTPSLFGQLQAMVTGGTPDRPGAVIASQNAKAAATGAAQLASSAGYSQDTANQLANYYTNVAAQSANDLAQSGQVWQGPSLLGMGWGTWALIGAGIVAAFLVWRSM